MYGAEGLFWLLDDLTTRRDFLEWMPISSDPEEFLWELGMADLVHGSGRYAVAA